MGLGNKININQYEIYIINYCTRTDNGAYVMYSQRHPRVGSR